MFPNAALPRELSIYTVGELHPQWLQWLQAPAGIAPLEVACAEVEVADAAGVQLLLSLSTGLQRQGRTLALLDPSSALLEACAALGLQGWAESLTARSSADLPADLPSDVTRSAA